MPPVNDITALARVLQPTYTDDQPHPLLMAQLRRIIRFAVSLQLDGSKDAAAALFKQLHIQIPQHLLHAVYQMNLTFAKAVTDCPNVCNISEDFVRFFFDAVECGLVRFDKWDHASFFSFEKKGGMIGMSRRWPHSSTELGHCIRPIMPPVFASPHAWNYWSHWSAPTPRTGIISGV